jgi:hypothetical protein
MLEAPLAALCAFDRRRLDDGIVAALCSVHPLRHDPAGVARFACYRVREMVVLEGEVDASAAPALEQVLRTMPGQETVVAGLSLAADHPEVILLW